MKTYDLSQPFFNDMPAAPNIGSFESKRIKTRSENGIQVTEFKSYTHTGTHMDALTHMIDSEVSVDKIPLDICFNTCHVADCPVGALKEISVADVEKQGFDIKPGDMIFFRTGYGAKFLDEDYTDAPSISVELAQWLADKKISIVGIDTNTVDITYCLRKPGFDFPVHHILFNAGIFIIEHLFLEEVAGKTLKVACFPINIKDADGAPVRVVGIE